MKSLKIVADSAIPFLRGLLEPWAEVVYLPGSAITRADVLEADALITRTRTRCNADLLEGSRIRLIATATIGFDHIDCAWCAAHGIRVVTAAGCNARGVLQWVAATLATLARRDGRQPAEQTLGVVGVGHVGSLVAEYAAAWGFRVLCCDPPREEREHVGFLPLEEVAAAADILTFHTPYDATTHHLADARLMSLMKRDAVLLNSSRGAVVDNVALKRSGLRFGLDVWEGEPDIDRDLLARAEVATPHIAGYSEQGKAMATAMSVNAIAGAFDLPLRGWYPADAAPSTPRPISWEALLQTIDAAFDIAAQTAALRQSPEAFESLRDHYTYRREYF